MKTKGFDLNEGIETAYELCPYCKHRTADPIEGYIEDHENEDDPDSGETRWYCKTCDAEWWAWGQDQPTLEKVLMISPRYPDDD